MEHCIGCSICERRCPVDAITGEMKELYYIHPDICIDCNACAVACPVDAIKNERGEVVKLTKPKERAFPIIDPALCSGCEFCVDHCPYDCLVMEKQEGDFFPIAKFVNQKACVNCHLCEEVCIKNAILVVPEE